MKVNEIICESKYLTEAARIQHAEDFVLWEGSAGAKRILQQLANIGSAKDISLKWDGSPCLYAGRDQSGQFILTDKSGFTAKGYNGLATSAQELESMFLNRGKDINNSRRQFARNMAALWDRFEQVVPEDFRGFVKGDLLYSTLPQIDNNNDYTFTPNTVTYHIAADSDIGKRMSRTSAGIAVHSKTVGPNQPDERLDINELNLNGPVLIIGPTFIEHGANVDQSKIKQASTFVQKYARDIDSFLDANTLASMKMSDVPDIFYTYINAMVKTGQLDNLAGNFSKWLPTSKVSAVKQAKLLEYINQNSKGAVAILTTIQAIMTIKDEIVNQLDSADSPIRASINGAPGGEGYVAQDSKLVNRQFFSQANFAKERS